MPGPPPKHPSQRRRPNAGPALTQLPAEGRKGPAPKWPLSKAKPAEAEVWADLWKLPQAVVWERLKWFRSVARYVRCLIEVEGSGPSTRMLAEVRQMEDRLGLSPAALMRLRWEIVADEVGEARAARSSPRMRAVDPVAVAGA
jgi:hypothetical protein